MRRLFGRRPSEAGSFIPIDDPRLMVLREIPVGACFNPNIGPDGRSHGFVLVPCSEQHALELFGRGDIDPAFSEYPDAETLAAEADRVCRPLFEDYVGINYNDSRFIFWTYDPHPDDWPRDRTIHCALGNATRTIHDSGPALGTAL